MAEGLYDLTATKYGYEAASVHSIEVQAALQTQLDLRLTAQPLGVLHGRVVIAASGQPLSATVRIVDTPVSAAVDAQGYYTLTAVAGACTVRAMPDVLGYRGAEVSAVAILADGTTTLDFYLDSAPRVLLVDADAGVASYAAIYRADLDVQLLPYAVHSIRSAPADNPSAAKLAGFDVVIWSQPVRSPGYIGAWSALSAYLSQGGKLLISGQDIGYWDDEQNYGRDAYRQYLHAQYVNDNGGLDTLSGVQGGALEGLALTYNTADSASNQTKPDAISARDGLAQPLLSLASATWLGWPAMPAPIALCTSALAWRA